MKLLFRLILISTGGLFLSYSAKAQVDFSSFALTMNQTTGGGTARVLGLGGNSTALGGDLSSISFNPAGLGFYNRSDIGITSILSINSNNTNYLGSSNNNSSTKFSIGNLGVVFNKTKADEVPGAWRGGSFGISYDRINTFNDDIRYAGQNIENDYLDFVIDFADVEQVQPGDYYLVDLPYYTYLINDYSVAGIDTTFGDWDSFVEFASEDTPVKQSEQIKRSGFQNKFSFSYGGNLNDVFYFGIGVGIMTVKYTDEKIYREDRYDESILNNYTLSEKQTIEGAGVNATFGFIFRPIPIVTVGVNYQTPTVYSLTDEYQTYLNSIWNSSAFDVYGNDPDFIGDQYAEQYFTGPDALNYSLTTPMKLNTGIAVFLNKNGFISADVEWVNNPSLRYSSDDYDFSNDNQKIEEIYRSTVNYKVGGEFRRNMLRLRAGYNYVADPLVNKEEINRSIHTFSGGAGLRKKAFYLDFTVLYSMNNSIRAPYIIYPDQGIGSTPVADINLNSTRLVLTAGILF